MDKASFPYMRGQASRPSAWAWTWTSFRSGILVLVSLVIIYHISGALEWVRPIPAPAEKASRNRFEWSAITPSSSFDWHSCYGDFYCARLDVPLDWSASPEQQKAKRAAVAVIKLPAKVPVTHPKYGGAILTNPGGPGGSGVHFAILEAKLLQTIADTGGRDTDVTGNSLHYDIIGFDPRGVNHTTPSPSCFPDDASRQFWSVAKQGQGSLALNSTFPLIWSRIKALSESCSRKIGEEWEGIGRYMNTPQVATDMVAITEALGESRERQALQELKTIQIQDRDEVRARTRWNKGAEPLQYWGFSYGTLLGSTFASLYPSRVKRLALDGVCDADDYYGGTWLSNLVDTDNIIGSFFRQCRDAGPSRCALWSEGGIDDIRKKYHQILTDISDSPIPVDAHGKYTSDIVTLSDAMDEVRLAVYQPVQQWKHLARTFALLARGNGTALAALKQDQSWIPACPLNGACDSPYADTCYATENLGGFKPEISAAILCTDGPADQLQWEARDHFEKWQALREQSHSLGDYWAEITMFCANWNLRPKWAFGAEDIAHVNKTAHPMLFVSTVRDPVTPLQNAQKMQRKFEGSGLLVTDGDGHCSMSAPGLCVARRVSEYFQRGTLPEEGTVCVPDVWPFDEEREMEGMGEGVREVVMGMRRLAGRVRSGAPLGVL